MSSDKHIAALREIQAIVNAALREASTTSGSKESTRVPRITGSGAQLSFDMNVLAFMKKYGSGLSGPQKFALLLARLAKGSASAEVPYQDIRTQWNKMKSVVGSAFNDSYGNRAKAHGWVDSQKRGMWKLTSAWKGALR